MPVATPSNAAAVPRWRPRATPVRETPDTSVTISVIKPHDEVNPVVARALERFDTPFTEAEQHRNSGEFAENDENSMRIR
jgi:hypothetical protein